MNPFMAGSRGECAAPGDYSHSDAKSYQTALTLATPPPPTSKLANVKALMLKLTIELDLGLNMCGHDNLGKRKKDDTI